MIKIPQAKTRLLTSTLPEVGGVLSLDEDALEAAKVLRLRPGDSVVLLDGQGGWAEAEINFLQKSTGEVLIQSRHQIAPTLPRIHLIQGIPKLDKAEAILQKTTELGIHRVSFAQTDHAVPHKKPTVLTRWQKIVREACRQSGEPFLPHIDLYPSLDATFECLPATAERILCNETHEKNNLIHHLQSLKNPSYIVLAVGPEGGWSEKEILKFHEKGFISIYLNVNTLKTETASIVSVAIARLYMLQS